MQNIDDVIIELPEYNEKIKQQFKATSEFIRNLPLTREQNDELVYRLADDVRAAREDGFACAICKLIESEASTNLSDDAKVERTSTMACANMRIKLRLISYPKMIARCMKH